MTGLKFCPKCGNKTLQFDGKNKLYCNTCDFVIYHNCAAAVAVIIKHKDEVLLTKRSQNPGMGKLDLAGGFTDPEESAEETCARELQEELGLNIEPHQFKFIKSLPNIYPYKGIDYNTLDLFFEYETDNKIINKLETQEISEVIWVKLSELNIEDIAFESQKKFLQEYQKKAP